MINSTLGAGFPEPTLWPPSVIGATSAANYGWDPAAQ
jgi:hypothetical protein